MTPEDLALDLKPLTESTLTLYRLARARFANLSGVGAAQCPGRWNRPGQEAIYTSIQIAVPVLERLAHTPKDLIPSNLALMKLSLKIDKTKPVIYTNLALAKKAFHQTELDFTRGTCAVFVPSVIVPVWNVVLYPRNSGFWDGVTLEGIEPFDFDPRLFPENTPVET